MKSLRDVALTIVRYIKNDPCLSILLDSKIKPILTAYCDSDYAGRIESRRSIIGYCIKFGNFLVFWKVKKQNSVSRSSGETDYRSMGITLSEIIWLRRLLVELGVPQT